MGFGVKVSLWRPMTDEYNNALAIGPAVYSCPVSDLGVRASTEWVRLGQG